MPLFVRLRIRWKIIIGARGHFQCITHTRSQQQLVQLCPYTDTTTENAVVTKAKFSSTGIASSIWCERRVAPSLRVCIVLFTDCDEPRKRCSDSQFNNCREMKQPSGSVLGSLGRPKHGSQRMVKARTTSFAEPFFIFHTRFLRLVNLTGGLMRKATDDTRSSGHPFLSRILPFKVANLEASHWNVQLRHCQWSTRMS